MITPGLVNLAWSRTEARAGFTPVQSLSVPIMWPSPSRQAIQ
ncbi:hypothetical protein [Actinomadura chokoriensis]